MSTAPTAIFEKIIKADFRKWFADWVETATPGEKTGLQIINFIFDTRGLVKADKKIKQTDPDVRELYHSDFNLQASEAFFKKKVTQTCYMREFGAHKGVRIDNNILRYMKIKETEYISWLTDLAAEFLERWRNLSDDLDTQNYVVECMRSLNARFRFHQKPVTEYK